jgi:hypothetical protein
MIQDAVRKFRFSTFSIGMIRFLRVPHDVSSFIIFENGLFLVTFPYKKFGSRLSD